MSTALPLGTTPGPGAEGCSPALLYSLLMYASGEAIPLSTERGEFDSRHGRMCKPFVAS